MAIALDRSKDGSQTAPATSADRKKNVKRTAAAGIVGSIIEFYDFTLFGLAAAVVFGPLFFPSQSPAAQTISALLTFAIGYIGRPIGGIVFSHFGDRWGRKPMLLATLLIMGVSTLAIGMLPTYQSVGLWAPVLLAICRIVQGMGAGAEQVGTMVMMAENGGKKGLGLRISLPGMGTFGGIVIATAVFALVSTLPEEALFSWGWRLPFFFAVITIAIGIWIRFGITETEEFSQVEDQGKVTKVPALEAIKQQWNRILVGWGIAGPYLAFSTLVQVYMLSYITKTLEMPASFGLTANLVSSILAVAGVPFFGWLTDRVGRVTVWLFSMLMFVVFGLTAFGLFGTGNELIIIATMVLGLSIALASGYASHSVLLSRLFKPEHRLSGLVLVREPMSAFLAGPIAAVAAALVTAAGDKPWPVTLLFVGFAVIGAVTAFATRAWYKD
ncbi:MFS transporter [Brevibacterium sp. 91QC2O2]|uniref:MFS transporter n=1 Tax=Brevibacterium sp. 91QC2O2 TaxID=2968458 RepID=UPI00211C194D|nr:MFS transporter [Brevibacterium sp. 91QC2O2]MCQ9367113.1 MFS transporter [Brevibacterium sp. 91QC2O2]